MQEKYIPVLFEGSQYAKRIPIGKKEIIEGAPYETIKKFYYDWYRPDLILSGRGDIIRCYKNDQ
jgi:zinc protease